MGASTISERPAVLCGDVLPLDRTRAFAKARFDDRLDPGDRGRFRAAVAALFHRVGLDPVFCSIEPSQLRPNADRPSHLAGRLGGRLATLAMAPVAAPPKLCPMTNAAPIAARGTAGGKGRTMDEQAQNGEQEKQIEELVEQLDENRIDRRELVRRASALGVSAAAIGAALTRVEAAAAQDGAGTEQAEQGENAMTEGTAANTLAQLSDDLAAAVELAGAAVVTVNARRRMPASGIVWSADGLIVTANHVVEQDEEITVGLPDGRTVPAALVGRDPGSDLALLQAEATGLTPAPRAESPARIGHFVLAVARPGPSGAMASFGVVSTVGGAWRTPVGGTVEGFVRADVAMLPGFSGGPLVDARGTILGLNSSTLGRGGGLTVPTAAIDKVVAALRSHGKVRRGFLGIGAQAARLPAALVAANKLAKEQGLLVVSVEPESPAERDGLLIGDVIVALNGETVAEVEELQDRLTGDWVGQSLPVRVIRGGAPQELRVTIGERS